MIPDIVAGPSWIFRNDSLVSPR